MEQSQEARHWLLRRRTRLVLAWLLALIASTLALVLAWYAYSRPGRRDGNEGHVIVDFGGQWLLARMLVTGQGRYLYDRPHLQALIEQSYPPEQGDPSEEDTDAERMYGWLIGGRADNGAPESLGGPLYPPIHALLFAPLALLSPQPAYHVMQVLTLLLAWWGAFLVRGLTHGTIWWPVAVVLIVIYPGFPGAISLGQNPMLSLTLLLLGWRLLQQGRPIAGGVAWGFLAYKPVWAVAFFLVPLLLRLWRFAAAMLLTGVLLALLTLPFVGLSTWLDWLRLGRLASLEYGRLENWVFLSRDLQSIPRRWMLHFHDQEALDADRLLPTLLGVGLWLTVVAGTVLVTLRCRRSSTPLEGVGAAFVLLGAWLSGYHFMYYDVLLTALPFCLLFTHPRLYGSWLPDRPRSLIGLHTNAPPLLLTSGPETTGEANRPDALSGWLSWLWAWMPVWLLILLIGVPYLCALLDPAHRYPPFDTFCLLLLWAWCGWSWQRRSLLVPPLLDLSRS